MGLDVSHGAFSGAYSSFNRFRQAIAKVTGGSFPPHRADADGIVMDDDVWYWGDGFSESTHRGLFVLLSHSDCDGEISPEDCVKVADELESLLPQLDAIGDGSGHILRDGGYGGVARKFIAGCREAAAANESLEFM